MVSRELIEFANDAHPAAKVLPIQTWLGVEIICYSRSLNGPSAGEVVFVEAIASDLSFVNFQTRAYALDRLRKVSEKKLIKLMSEPLPKGQYWICAFTKSCHALFAGPVGFPMNHYLGFYNEESTAGCYDAKFGGFHEALFVNNVYRKLDTICDDPPLEASEVVQAQWFDGELMFNMCQRVDYVEFCEKQSELDDVGPACARSWSRASEYLKTPPPAGSTYVCIRTHGHISVRKLCLADFGMWV